MGADKEISQFVEEMLKGKKRKKMKHTTPHVLAERPGDTK